VGACGLCGGTRTASALMVGVGVQVAARQASSRPMTNRGPKATQWFPPNHRRRQKKVARLMPMVSDSGGTAYAGPAEHRPLRVSGRYRYQPPIASGGLIGVFEADMLE
jgi:hypothetical protein